jgi:GNAT superfamily N-acetyltransferase
MLLHAFRDKMMLISLMLLHNGVEMVAITDANYLLIESLVDESKQEGFEFVQRTIDDWNSGANRFRQAGEGFWGLVSGAGLIGMGGLNIDPYVEDAGTGRVRHLYIRQAYRRKGCAALLMNTIIERAQLHFHLLRLFTANPGAAVFYEKLGFEHLPGDKVSHVLTFDKEKQ